MIKHVAQLEAKIVSEYDQEIPLSQTADKPVVSRDSHTTITRHQEDKQSKAIGSLFPIKMIAKLEWTQSNSEHTTKHRTITESHNGSYNQQRINNNNRTTAPERTAAKASGGGLNAFHWFQTLTLDSDVVEAQKILSPHGDFLTIAMYYYKYNLIKLSHHDETEKAHDSQIVRAKKNLQVSHGGPASAKHQAS